MNRKQIKQVKKELEKIQEKIGDGFYIFRGERQHNKKISSALYRSYEKICKEELGLAGESFSDELNLTTNGMQDFVRENVKEYVHIADSESLLTELQHYGGHTNRIDFSRDYLIALFFACNGDEQLEDDGRLILLRKDFEGIIKPRKNQNNRVISQRSIFVEQDSGYIPDDTCVIHLVPMRLKPLILKYLEEYHGISKETIYGDLPGYIENQEDYQKSHIYFQKGFNHSKNGEYAKAISAYDESIRLKSSYANAYFNRGYAHARLNNYEEAIADCDKVIELNSKKSAGYSNRGIVKKRKGDFDGAVADYNKAIELNPNIINAHANLGVVKKLMGSLEEAKAHFQTALRLAEEQEDKKLVARIKKDINSLS